MASVWCAQDVVLGRRVAIKLLGEQFTSDRGAVMRFKREARAAARLSAHRNVVTIFDVGQTAPEDGAAAGRPFIVMECLTGGTVADALRVGEFSREEALRWLHEAAAAIDYAHGRGVIHRDIKPANLLLDGERVLHVADFGIARVGTEDTITTGGQLFGTAAYLSPEQARGLPATEASDRYALAVVAHELLVGERPFAGENFAVQARQHIDQDPPPASARNPTLPPTVDGVLAQGMAKQPEQRWPSAQAFVQALGAALADEPPFRAPAVPPSPTSAAGEADAVPAPVFARDRRGHGAGTRPRALAVVALAAVAVALLAAVIAGGGSSRPTRLAQAAGSRLPAHAAGDYARSTRRSRPAARKPAPATPAATHTATALPAAATTAAPTADTLEAQGHSLMLSGQPTAAVDVLRRAVAAAAPSSLTYAYALYDLGKSLLLAGDPRDAAVVLQRRLQIPNQTDVVRQELQLALQQLGTRVNQAAPAPAPQPAVQPGSPPHHGHGQGHGGGD